MRRFLMIITLLLSLPLVVFPISKEEAQAAFNTGNQAYEAGQYQEALNAYLTVGEDFVSFEYFFNVGNTYYRLDDIAHAILFYEKAAKIDPGNEDLKLNLKIANGRVKDKIEELPSLGVENLWDQLVAAGMLGTWTWLAIIGWLFTFLAIGGFLLASSRVNKRFYLIAAFFLFIAAVVSFGMGRATMKRISESREAIIISPTVDVLNSPNGSDLQFVLHEGTKVQVRQIQGDWTEIRIANGSVGWVKNGECEGI